MKIKNFPSLSVKKIGLFGFAISYLMAMLFFSYEGLIGNTCKDLSILNLFICKLIIFVGSITLPSQIILLPFAVAFFGLVIPIASIGLFIDCFFNKENDERGFTLSLAIGLAMLSYLYIKFVLVDLFFQF